VNEKKINVGDNTARQVELIPEAEAAKRLQDAQTLKKLKPGPKRKAAKGGVMEKSAVYPKEEVQSDEDDVRKTTARPEHLQMSLTEKLFFHVQ
jgi:hypothetical protein